MEDQKQGNGAMLWVVAVVVVALLAFGGYKYMNKSSSTNAEIPLVNNVDTTVPVATTPGSVYKNGTYSVTGSYVSPGGNEDLPVTVTLNGDLISDVNVTVGATRKESVYWQEKFIADYKILVVGKKINEVKLTKVSGSSLTPKGFMDALAKIETQAKV